MGRDKWEVGRTLVSIALLPNVVLAVATAHLGGRPIVNLDYVAIAAVSPFVGPAILTLLLSVALAVDVVFSIAPAFNFGPTEVVAAVEQVRHVRGRAVAFALGTVALVVASGVGLTLLRGKATPTRRIRATVAATCGALAAVVCAADIANGSNAVGWRARRVVGADISSSQFISRFAGGTTTPSAVGQPIPAATDGLRRLVEATPDSVVNGPRKIVLVIVEAMGFPKGVDQDALFAPLTHPSLSRRFAIRTGSVPFHGATTSGEFRELCGRQFSHFTARDARLDGCLPARLRSLGFETVAIHAYAGDLFQRREWYPRVGFDRAMFLEDVAAKASLPECGTMFRGICDSSMTDVLRAELTRDRERRQLLYWLTLSSHFPLDPRSTPAPAVCAALGRAGREDDVCRLWSAVWPVLEGIADLMRDSTVPPAWYILVGDHAPPQLFADTSLYHSDRVPFIELRPLASESKR